MNLTHEIALEETIAQETTNKAPNFAKVWQEWIYQLSLTELDKRFKVVR